MIADEAATLGGEGLGGADDLDAQARAMTQLPQQANADLHALAMIARQGDQPARVRAEKRLQFAMHVGLVQGAAVGVFETEGREVVNAGPSLRHLRVQPLLILLHWPGCADRHGWSLRMARRSSTRAAGRHRATVGRRPVA